MCIMESPWAPPHQTLVFNLCKLKKNQTKKKNTLHTRNTCVAVTLSHIQTQSLKFIHPSYNNQYNGFASPLLSEVRDTEANGSNEVNTNSWDIAQTSAGTEYNSLSFQQPSLCIGRIKHLWCSQTLNPSCKALLYTKVERQMSLESTHLGRYPDLHDKN